MLDLGCCRGGNQEVHHVWLLPIEKTSGEIPFSYRSKRNQKMPVRNFSTHTSRAGFVGAWDLLVFLLGNLHAEGCFGFVLGGECEFYLHGRGDFSEQRRRRATGKNTQREHLDVQAMWQSQPGLQASVL